MFKSESEREEREREKRETVRGGPRRDVRYSGHGDGSKSTETVRRRPEANQTQLTR